MSDITEIERKIFDTVVALHEDETISVSDDTPLLGDSSVLDSMKLLEVCLSLEDMAAELGFEFDWTSEEAMSRSRSMFRTAGALATEFLTQMKSKK